MADKLKVLFVASEADPFIKTGGLGDVAGSLPAEMNRLGHDVRVVIPEYSQIPDKFVQRLKPVCHFRNELVWRDNYVGVNTLEEDGVTFYFIDSKKYFHRDSLYENIDREEQFAFFNQSVLDMLPKIDFQPDIIHCNDWQTGPLPLIFADRYRQHDFYSNMKTIFTIHNLRYQGQFPGHIANDLLGVSSWHWESGNIRHNGLVNYMKCGIMYADQITTVSETYAQEIKTEYYGEGLDYALRLRGDDLSGIINGISYEKFNPAHDQNLVYNYQKDELKGKTKNKLALQKELGLKQAEKRPILAVVSRLVEQKGLDLIKGIFEELMESNIQFVLLGTGQYEYEEFFRAQNEKYPDKFTARIMYDASLAQRIYAGSDMFLVPSKYEPCGLSQLISFRYGTIPIVRETGGLNDTVHAYDEDNEEGNGFTFTNYNAHDMLYTIQRAVSIYQQEDLWSDLVKKVMDLNYSWEQSAGEYLKTYARTCSKVIEITGAHEKLEQEIRKEVIKEAAATAEIEKEKKINLKSASTEELVKLPGIGLSYAKRIIKYRKIHGLTNLTDLLKVKGIGEKTFNNIKQKLEIK